MVWECELRSEALVAVRLRQYLDPPRTDLTPENRSTDASGLAANPCTFSEYTREFAKLFAERWDCTKEGEWETKFLGMPC